MLNKSSEITFIGAGNVAHTLVPLLVKKNFKVKGIVSRSIKSARSLSNKYKLEFSSESLNAIPPDVKIFFITVPDSQISIIAARLSKLRKDFTDSLFVHTSGSEGSSALKILEDKGAMTASFHIMQTFPSRKQTDIRNSFASIETRYIEAGRYLFSLGRTLDLKSFPLNEDTKVYYHMAGVFAANFINASLYSSEVLLEKTGLPDRNHFNIYEPIIKTTIANIKDNGPSALSGPVQRGDSVTITKHLKALNKLKSGARKFLIQSYISQSMILLEIIKGKEGKLNAGQKEIKKILTAAIKKSKRTIVKYRR